MRKNYDFSNAKKGPIAPKGTKIAHTVAVKSMSLKGKVLHLTGGDMTQEELTELATKLAKKGVVGILWLPEDMNADSATIEECIKKLEAMRDSNAGKSSPKP